MSTPSETAKVLALERPDPALWTLYLVRAILTVPAILITLPYLYFRYHTLRYRFDEEGIHMRVGILFRREVNITYARIQDIHLKSGLLQRWLGLADVQIQTASSSAGAEMIIEGFKEFESVRDFLYSRIRGAREKQSIHPASTTPTASSGTNEIVDLLVSIRDELRGARELLDQRGTGQPLDRDV